MANTGRATNPLWGDTVLAGEAMANTNRIVKLSTAANKTILLAVASTDVPVGVMPDAVTYEIGDDAMFRHLGREKVKLGGTVTRGDRIVAGAAGVGVICPSTGAHGVVGFALQSGVIGDVIEFLCIPHFFNAEASALGAFFDVVGLVNTIVEGGQFELGTVTGLELGTAAGQKLAFWGATPVVQEAHVDDPAAAAAQTQVTMTDSTTGTPATTLVPMTAVGGSGATTGQEGEINDNFSSVDAQLVKIKADVASCLTALGLHKTAVDAINAKDATLGLTAAS